MMVSLADPALAISWRMGHSGDFHETGLLDELDPLTRKRKPRSDIELQEKTPAGTFEVRYVDINGVMQGPFPIRFDPVQAQIENDRRGLEQTFGTWVSVSQYNGALRLNYSSLVGWRCGIREAYIGIDTPTLDQLLKIPACNQQIGSDYMDRVLPRTARMVSVKLFYADGTVSDIHTYDRR